MDFIRNYIFVILTILGILFFGAQAVVWRSNPFSGVVNITSADNLGGDYQSYYFASKHFMRGENIYFSSQQATKYEKERIDTFVYPPLMAVLLVPFTVIPLEDSYVVFTVFSIIIFLLSLYFLSRRLPKSNVFFSLSVVAFFSSPIIVLHLARGQTDIIILLLLVVSLVAFFERKSFFAGVAVGIAAALKVTPLIFLPYFFIKDKKAFWSAIATLSATVILFQASAWADFFERIRSFAGSVSSGNLSNSLLGVIYNKNFFDYYSQGTASLIYLCAVLLILSITFFAIYKNNRLGKFTLIEFGIITTFMVIVPSVSWAYNGVHSLVLLAAYWSIRFNGSLNKWTYFFFDILAYLLLSQPLLSPLIRNFPIYHIFSLRAFMYLCFVALFIYTIHMEKINDYVAKFKLTRFYTSSFIRFCIVGFAGTASNLLVFYLVSKMANINIAAILAFTLAVTQNYLLNHSWSFKHHSISKPNIKGYYRYVFVNLFGLSLNLIILNALVGLGLNVLVAQVVGVLAGVSLNYAGSYFFVFIRKASD